MLSKINRKDCLDKYQVFPQRTYNNALDEEEFVYPKTFKSYILTLLSKSFKGHIKMLGVEIMNLLQYLQEDALLFLGDTNMPWLHQNNDYKPVRAAYEYFTNNKVGNRFNGTLVVNASELPTFITHLAWLTRCNAAMHYIYFSNSRQTILGNICQYGNLHLDTLTEQADTEFKTFMRSSLFEYGNLHSCNNQFGRTSAIYGRRITI
ncbi:MAG: hypothetical protein QM802_04105 [Agriterribacter sp.]